MFEDAPLLVHDVLTVPEQGWTVPEQGWTVPPFLFCIIAHPAVIFAHPVVIFVDLAVFVVDPGTSCMTLRCSWKSPQAPTNISRARAFDAQTSHDNELAGDAGSQATYFNVQPGCIGVPSSHLNAPTGCSGVFPSFPRQKFSLRDALALLSGVRDATRNFIHRGLRCASSPDHCYGLERGVNWRIVFCRITQSLPVISAPRFSASIIVSTAVSISLKTGLRGRRIITMPAWFSGG